jgi:hypothetical protein
MGGDVWALDVFRRAYALSLDVHRASQGFPKSEQYGGVADQVRRASKSVCALLAEGSRRQVGSDVEFRRYVMMALGSVEGVGLRRGSQTVAQLRPRSRFCRGRECGCVAVLLRGGRAHAARPLEAPGIEVPGGNPRASTPKSED